MEPAELGKTGFSIVAPTHEIYYNLGKIHAGNKMCDIIIRVENRVFPCHRVVLASASGFFFSMFGGKFRESTAVDVSLNDIDAATFETVLKFIYTGALTFTAENAFKLLTAGDYLHMPYIENACKSYLQDNTPKDDVVLDILLYACYIEKMPLAALAYPMIAKNFVRFSKAPKLILVPFRMLGRILSHKELEKDNDAITEFLVKWARVISSRARFVPQLLKDIELENRINVSITLMSKLISNQFTVNVDEPVTIQDSHDEMFRPTDETVLEVSVVSAKQNVIIYTLNRDESTWNFEKELFPRRDGFFFTDIKSVSVDTHLYTMCARADDSQHLDMQFIMRSNFNETKSVSLSLPDELQDFFCLAAIHSSIYVYYECAFSSEYDDGTKPRFYIYDCIINRWYPLNTKGTHFRNAGLTAMNNLLYVIGGRAEAYNYEGTDCVHFYDPRSGKWDKLPNMITKRVSPTPCAWNGKLYVASGYSNTFEVFDPVAYKWCPLQSLVDDDFHVMVPYKNKLWILGGEGDSNLICKYDPSKDQWFDIPRIDTGELYVHDGVVHEFL